MIPALRSSVSTRSMEPWFPPDVSVSDQKQPSVGGRKTLYTTRASPAATVSCARVMLNSNLWSASKMEAMRCHLSISEKVLVRLRSGIRDHEQKLERGDRPAPTLRLMQKAVP